MKVNVTCYHLHIQRGCKNGGGVYDRNKTINDNIFIVLWNDRFNYHKYCLNNNISYNYEQIKIRHICFLRAMCRFNINYVVTAFLRLSFPTYIIYR